MEGLLKPWRPSSTEWDAGAAMHLMRRAGFGPRPGDVAAAADDGFEATLERVLGQDEHDEGLHGGAKYLLAAGDIDQLAAWWMALILAGGAPLRERMTLLWHDHFATSNDKVDDVRLMHRQNELFRRKGLGDFRELLHAVAKDPAMLLWLDGNENKRGQPNENFAREVMELFALGIGNYTERDIQAAARAFTGWGTKGRSFHVRETDHDDGPKEIFGKRGAFRGEDAIDLVIAHPACPRLVARRLLEEFVAPQPEQTWVNEAADLLVASDWHVGRTVESILRSNLFFSSRARRTRIAGPVELLATSLRSLDATMSPQDAANATSEMGQTLFRPPSVKGWDGGRAWINAGTWVARHNRLAAVAEAEAGVEVRLEATLGNPASPEEAARLVRERLAPDLEDAAFAEALTDAARGCSSVEEATRLSVAAVLTSPEYHLF